MSNKVVICGVDTALLPKKSSKEMLELLLRVKNKEYGAREEFVKNNMRLVLSIVQRFCLKPDNVDDVFQVGIIGLLKAIDNFDLSVGVKFSTYAVPMIIGEIRRFLRDNSSLKVTRNMRDIAYRALKAREELQLLKGEATISEIAKMIDISEFEIGEALDAISEPVSIYETVFNDGSDTLVLEDQLKDTFNSEEHWLESTTLENAIDDLDSRERSILCLRYFEGKTQMEVSEEIGISQAQVSRLEKNALSSMKELL